MKQTNNAIKFLMAQYRAIFKNAYFKGIATALVLTAGLGMTANTAEAKAPTLTGDNTHYYFNFSNKKWGQHDATKHTQNGITAGAIAGDGLSGDNITTEQGLKIATSGDLVIGSGSGALTSITSGTAAGGWAQANEDSAITVSAIHNTVTVNSSGSVTKNSADNRGGIYGGYALAKAGTAIASFNEITVQKEQNYLSTPAADEFIRGGRATGGLGATANSNIVTITGEDGHLQKVAVGSGTGYIGLGGGMAVVSSNDAQGTYEASGNELLLTAIEANDGQSLNFTGGKSDLSSGPTGGTTNTKGIASNNYIQLNDSKINVSGGTLFANQVQGASGASVSVIDGQGRGISISDSEISNSASADTARLNVIANRINGNGSGDSSATNGLLSIANTSISKGKSSVTLAGADLDVKSLSSSATNNVVQITEQSKNYNTDTKSYDNEINAEILGANITNREKTSDKLVITATGNEVNIGQYVSVIGDVTGASVSASGDKIATMSLNDNSVSVAGKVVGNIKAVSYTNSNAGGSIDAKKNKLSFLNNDVSLLAGADVSSGDLVGGAGKDSVVTIAAGSTYTANQSSNHIASDVIDIDGTVVVDASKELTISGFFENGKEDADKYHENLTTLGSSAVINNGGNITIYGKVVADPSAVITGTQGNSLITISADSTKHVTDPKLAKEDLVEGADFGVLSVSKDQVVAYLTDAKTVGSTDKDSAGKVYITSGGALEFTDEANIDLAKTFNFVAGNSADSGSAGQIVVDGSAGTSIIRGNEITVSEQLTKNAVDAGVITAATSEASVQATGANGIEIEANTLHLGNSDLSSADSEKILFKKATAKNLIDFSALNNSTNDGFHLVSSVYGDNYMLTTDQNTDTDYYTALDGDINGDVTITNSGDSSGALTIQNGNWVAHDNVTLAGSGSLTVGGDDGIDKNDPSADTKSPDATLAFDNDLVVDLSATGTETKITAQGVLKDYTKRYDFAEAAETIGDDRLAQIDLRNGLTIVGSSTPSEVGKLNGKTTITATSGGVILLDSTDLNTILTQNDANSTADASGAIFVANSGGAFIVTGDINADFNDFNDGTSAVNGITLKDNGYLVADSVSILNDGDNTSQVDSDYGNKSVNWGNGTLVVDDLVISDLQITTGTKPSGASNYASKVQVDQGNAEIAQSLVSNNHTLILGTTGDAGATAANFTFATDAKGNKGTIEVNEIQLNKGELKFLNGDWSANNTNFDLEANGVMTIGGDPDEDINDQSTEVSLNALALTMKQGSDLTVHADGTASFARADFNALTVAEGSEPQNVNVYGHLIIKGDTSATITQNNAQVDDPQNGVHFGAAGTLQIHNNGILEFGTDAVTGAIIADTDYSTATAVTEAMNDDYTKIANNGGVLKLNFTSGTEFTAEAIKQLKTELFTSGSLTDGVLNSGGILHIGDAGFYGIDTPEQLSGDGLSGYTADWADLKEFSDTYGNDVANTTLTHTNVKNIGVSDKVQGNWGSLTMASDAYTSAQVIIAGHTILNYAEGNRGYFISNASRDAALGANIQSQKSLKLVNNGTEAYIGNVTLQAGDNEVDTNRTTLEITGAGTTNISEVAGSGTNQGSTTGYAEGTLFKVGADTNVTGDIKNLDEVNVANANLTAKNTDVRSIETINSNVTIAETAKFNKAEILGGSFITKNATYDRNGGYGDVMTVSNGGSFTATEKFVFAETTPGSHNEHGVLEVGVDLSLLSDTDLTLADGSRATTGTGYFEAGVVELNGNTIVVDPDYGDGTSVASIGKFQLNDRQTYKYDNDKGVLEGEILIGKNAALGVGATVAETKEAISTYQQNGSLQEDHYGSILYLDGQLTVSDGSSISLNSSKDAKTYDDIREANKYVISAYEHDQYAALGLGANTAILMTEKAFEDDKGAKTGTAIYFDRKAAVVNGAGGDIILAGDFDAAEKLNIFNDKDNNGVRVEGSIDVRTQNGFLMYTLSGEDEGMGIKLQVDKPHAYGIMSDASDPVVETLIAYHTERGGATTDSNTNTGDSSSDDTITMSVIETNQNSTVAQAENRSGPILGTPSDTTDQEQGGTSSDEEGAGSEGGAGSDGSQDTPQTSNVRGYSSFLSMVSNNTHGAPAEAAARLAIYGGAVQAAMAATSSTTDAIAARMGVGNTANITMANNGQGAALWLAPVYKTHDSDSFDSQGLDYGVDLNLYGVALGADFEFMPGLTAGVMFNVGSGDADGQGNAAANNTSNDFDYWGAAIYGNYTYDALSVTADVSYTAVDNDLEATTGMQQYSKLESSTDTTAISLGVTAKYTFDFGGVEVAPHAGLRYTNIDLDDYSIKSNGETVADYSADKVNIFSIPVGVTFAKEFTGDAWTVKPSLDLTLTGNFGDDDISGDVSWTGVDNLVTPVSSEYMDDFTYGATLGIEAASTGGFSLGLGVNYTGSSNVDEFGVNANARFVF